MEYARRLLSAGADVTVLTYPKAHHGWERPGSPVWLPTAENYSRCLFWEEEDGNLVHAATGETLTPSALRERRREFCRLGAHAGGGGAALTRRTTKDILAFLEERGVFPAEKAMPRAISDGGRHATEKGSRKGR
jgi:acetyl esterase/lipase